MNALYWRGMSEAQLAAFQQRQVGNTCAAHAIAAALNLAYGLSLDGKDLGQRAYANWWRLWGNPFHAGIPPYAQFNLLAHLRQAHQLDFQARLYSSDPQKWRAALDQPDQLLLVTFYWLARPAFLSRALKNWKHPRITYGRSTANEANPNGVIVTGHTLLLVAHDPQHTTFSGEVRPWGFVNSWIDGGASLYWMADDDLRFPRQTVQIIL